MDNVPEVRRLMQQSKSVLPRDLSPEALVALLDDAGVDKVRSKTLDLPAVQSYMIRPLFCFGLTVFKPFRGHCVVTWVCPCCRVMSSWFPLPI